ncbi:MAG: hypothetical protein ACC707_17945, partial [Thiohalomonadales bacterium]
MRIYLLLILSIVISGCANTEYRETNKAELKGSLDVRWIENDYFLFLPNSDDPFTLVREDGTSINPGPMYTDGGSIPRFLWGVKGFSPWGYAPAYIIHDWVFVAHHCDYEPDKKYSFNDSVTLLKESLKAVMEKNDEYRNYFVFNSMSAGANSNIAKSLWEKGVCKTPP